ncbi:transcriptional repressor [Thermosulfurimonas marina]|uniref:Ferric uptake regulation protein n=1 Tax=Thermosulfurimonas marina TaxID=2047767 RepID=A0A6H1WRV1_9BACT|nr:transcriptional repressor [Thermosulfurimonas marina]QJA05884.1 transcriptional repressor [Thermosulfurimonas marina]
MSQPSEMEIFREFIRKKGLRYTPEREIILREILKIHDHFDVDELYLRLRNQGHRISKASIYRTLPLLIECGLVQEVYQEDGHMHYEHIYGHEPHAHFRCLSCRRVEEFQDERLEEVAEEFRRKHGAEIKRVRYELLGYCAACLKEG